VPGIGRSLCVASFGDADHEPYEESYVGTRRSGAAIPVAASNTQSVITRWPTLQTGQRGRRGSATETSAANGGRSSRQCCSPTSYLDLVNFPVRRAVGVWNGSQGRLPLSPSSASLARCAGREFRSMRYRQPVKVNRRTWVRFSVLIRRHFDLHPVRCANTSEDEIDPGEKILSVVVSPHRSGHAACERELHRIKLRPRGRHRF
jgi:hypothetical protein